MASDPNKPILKFDEPSLDRRAKGAPPRIPLPAPVNFPKRDARLGPKFDQLARALGSSDGASGLRRDPAALAPETLIVFEVSGSLINFGKAASRVPGLVIVGEEDEVEFDDTSDTEITGYYYLAIPNEQAIDQLLSLWRRYLKGEELAGYPEWRNVFDRLHDLRRWGPKDRVTEADRQLILDEAEATDTVKLEAELVFDPNRDRAVGRRDETIAAVREAGGRILSQASYDQFSYDAILVEVTSSQARAVAERDVESLAGDPNVFAIRLQSIFEPLPIEADDPVELEAPLPTGQAIAAILDAVPVAGHPILADRLSIDDPDDLAALAVGHRIHGTAMSSLVIWGDLLKNETALPRPVIVRPIMFAPAVGNERLRNERLIVDEVVRAVESIVGAGANQDYRDTILIVNLALGDRSRPFFGRMSPLARAIDWLSHNFGILFIVSAGNVSKLNLASVASCDEFRLLEGDERSEACLEGIRDSMADRTLLSPAEATNAITVGALHDDTMIHPLNMGLYNHDPHPTLCLPSIVSRIGPGFRRAVKPELVNTGGRLRVDANPVAKPAMLTAKAPSKYGGLKVAGPDGLGTAWTGATSGATALTTRGAHLIHDALERAYGEDFIGLPRVRRALIVKALLLHRVSIPNAARDVIEKVFGPAATSKWWARRANVQRLFGYGIPNIDEVIGCVESRATLWGHGSLGVNQAQVFDLPLPVGLFGNKTLRRVSATLAWFSPILAGMRSYKAVRLDIEEPAELDELGVVPQGGQVPKAASAKGTILHRSWLGKKLREAQEDGVMQIHIARKPDPTGQDIEGAVDFGLIVSLESDDPDIPIYTEVREVLAVKPRVPVPVQA